MKAIVDANLCIGCELCVQNCPEVFKMQEDKAVVRVDAIPEYLLEKCNEAADGCPVSAITIE